MKREAGVCRRKLACIERVNIKVLLCGAGNYIQYPVTNRNGGEYKKKSVCACKDITESLGCTAVINLIL